MVRSAALLVVIGSLVHGVGAIRPETHFRYKRQAAAQEGEHQITCPAGSATCGVMKFARLRNSCFKTVCGTVSQTQGFGTPRLAIGYLMKEVSQFHNMLNLMPPSATQPVGPTTTTTTKNMVVILEIEVVGIVFELLEADADLKATFLAVMRRSISDGLDIVKEAVECHLVETGAGSPNSMQVSVGHESVSVFVEAHVTAGSDTHNIVEEFHVERAVIDEIIALEISTIPGIESVSKGPPKVVTNEHEVEVPTEEEEEPQVDDETEVEEPGATSWQESSLNRVCRDPENCGPYNDARCRDAFCAGCVTGSCETLEEAQQCCLQAADCTAVYGGGAHWWTFHAPCAEENHPNFYNTWHRGGSK